MTLRWGSVGWPCSGSSATSWPRTTSGGLVGKPAKLVCHGDRPASCPLQRFRHVPLVLLSLAVALAIAEAGLRLLPHTGRYYVLVPGTDWKIKSAPEVVRGVRGENEYTVNELGIRGRLFGPDSGEYRILAVGASTTECANLDDSEVWTHLLEVDLAATSEGKAAWVGNVGRSGLTTRDNVLHLKYLPREYPQIDAVIALVGANDLQTALGQGWHYQQPLPITEPEQERAQLSRSFAGVPFDAVAAEQPFYKRTALWHLARRVKLAFNVRRQFDLTVLAPQGLVDWRVRRANARRWIDSLPSLAAPLAEYRRNLNAMADHAAAAGARLVFVTQPTLWADSLPDDVNRMLWFGWLGADRRSPEGYFTAGALARGMAAFNAELLQVCRERGVECVDAGSLSRDQAALYDDMHFTERGSELLAKQLAGHFRKRPPFRPPLPTRGGFPTIGRSRPQPSP